ncbi:MAG: penicillin-binding protein 2 [Candidatus Omnitrophota bacterium]|nr:penicillin-binding protein 2 [Candidatus Omnitrophota bacterium]
MRFLILRFLFFIGLATLGVSLFRVQVIKGPYYRSLGEKNRIRLIPLEAPRGRVFDRNGRLMATNRPSYDIVATPEDVTPEVFGYLSNILNLSEQEIRNRMSARREYPFAPAVIEEDVGRTLAFHIEERRPELQGVRIRISSLRHYPYAETASHIIGFIGKISPAEYDKYDGQRDRYGLQSWIGRAGIERIYDMRLRGWRGGRQLEVNAKGELMSVLSERKAEVGEDLSLSIDLEFQTRMMELLKDKHASLMVLDLESEEFVALASTPSFNPNVFVTPGQGKERMEFLRDKNAPLIDRGVSSAYPPGSVFKLVTAIAGLEKGTITPDSHFNCPGYFQLKPGGRKYHCWYKSGHGSLNLYEAIERSCNVYFYNLAKRVTADDIARYARELGLGEALQVEMTNIAPGLVPDSAWKKNKYNEKWYQGETLSFGIGQTYLLTSPIQILRLTATIAKGGKFVEPTLLHNHPEKARSKERVAIREENLKVIRRAMLNVVQSDYGTGQLARVDFEKMAAKTGTAQVPPKTAHSWITGFFPYAKPEIAFVVFVEHGGSGGVVAAGIAKEMLDIWRAMYVPTVG